MFFCVDKKDVSALLRYMPYCMSLIQHVVPIPVFPFWSELKIPPLHPQSLVLIQAATVPPDVHVSGLTIQTSG